LCSCGLRYAILESEGMWNVTFTTGGINGHIPPQCHEASLNSRRALLLGVALAEIALSTAIGVFLNANQEPTFDINGQILTKRELLKKVLSATSESFRNAVYFCFYFDDTRLEKEFCATDIV